MKKSWEEGKETTRKKMILLLIHYIKHETVEINKNEEIELKRGEDQQTRVNKIFQEIRKKIRRRNQVCDVVVEVESRPRRNLSCTGSSRLNQ